MVGTKRTDSGFRLCLGHPWTLCSVFQGMEYDLRLVFYSSCDMELISVMDYSMRRPVDLYVYDCSKKLVEEKDNNELEVMDSKPNDTVEPNPINAKLNVDANADDEGDKDSDDIDGDSDEDYMVEVRLGEEAKEDENRNADCGEQMHKQKIRKLTKENNENEKENEKSSKHEMD